MFSAIKYECDICKKIYCNNKEMLRLHIEKVHQGILTNFKCEMCDKTFSRKGIIFELMLNLFIKVSNRLKSFNVTFARSTYLDTKKV